MKRKRYLLVVDDHEGIRRLMREFLSGEGYVVETAGSGEEALQAARSEIPLLVLLDVRMPGLSGFKTLSRLLEIDPCIPVIMITAYTELHEVREAKKAGLIRYFINKPFDLNDVRNIIKNVLSQSLDKNIKLNST